MNGFLNVHKPTGITSHDVVARVRRLVGKGVKVGHAGTLDPAASGVLPLALGMATRLVEYLTNAGKGYRALVRLGTTTATDDAEGEVVSVQSVPVLNEEALRAALIPFQGDILQIPPMYSALHHQGKRLYDLARAGETVERAPRPVTISQLDLLEYRPPDLITLTIACSKGTYIRSLARDLGAALGCGAHLAALERTFVGAFTLDAATPLAALEADATVLPGLLLPPELAVIAWPAIALSETQAALLRHGRPLHLPPGSGDHVRAHAPGGALLALLQRDDELWHPHKVFL